MGLFMESTSFNYNSFSKSKTAETIEKAPILGDTRPQGQQTLAPAREFGLKIRSAPSSEPSENASNSAGSSTGKLGSFASLDVKAGVKDRRVRIKVPAEYLNSKKTQGYNGDLKNVGGIIFPYTPQISIEHKADYKVQTPLHSNYYIHFYVWYLLR